MRDGVCERCDTGARSAGWPAHPDPSPALRGRLRARGWPMPGRFGLHALRIGTTSCQRHERGPREGALRAPLCLSRAPQTVLRVQASGFAYTKDEMLQIYKEGRFREMEFTDKFQHVVNATTPEYLIPLALLPIEPEEKELRLAPVVVGQPGGQGRGRGGYQDREGGKGGRGKGRDGKGGDRDGGKGGRDGWGRQSAGGDVRNSGGAAPWESPPGRGQRDSNGVDSLGVRDSGGGGGDAWGAAYSASEGLPPAAPAPPPPKDWFYRDLEKTVQGPFSEAQISEWFTAGYLPADLPMRSADSPPDAYTPLNEMVAAGGGEPPFVRANRVRVEYEAQRDRLKAAGPPRGDDGQHDAQRQAQAAAEAAARAQAEAAAQAQAQAQAQAVAQQQQREAEARAQAEAQARAQAEAAQRHAEEMAARQAAEAAAEAQRREVRADHSPRPSHVPEAAIVPVPVARLARSWRGSTVCCRINPLATPPPRTTKEAPSPPLLSRRDRSGPTRSPTPSTPLTFACVPPLPPTAQMEEVRRRAEEDTRRQMEEERRRIMEEARRQAEEEARQMQQRLQAEAEMKARQQADELARRQTALEEAQRRQAESEAAARQQAEELARRQAALQEQQRVLSMLPPANNPAAGSALLSLLQGTSNPTAGLSSLPGWNAQPPPAADPAPPMQAPGHDIFGLPTPQNAAPGQPQASANGQDATLASWGRGRGRGRGVCSAALGTARRGESEPGGTSGVLGALGALGLDTIGGPDGALPSLPGMGSFPQYTAADGAGMLPHGAAEAVDSDAQVDEGGKKGRKSKREKKRTDGAEPIPAPTDAASRAPASPRGTASPCTSPTIAPSLPNPCTPPLPPVPHAPSHFMPSASPPSQGLPVHAPCPPC